MEALVKAKSNQGKALTRMRAEGTGNLTEQQAVMAEVCCALAQAQESTHEEGAKDLALATYREGPRHCETHEPSLVTRKTRTPPPWWAWASFNNAPVATSQTYIRPDDPPPKQ